MPDFARDRGIPVTFHNCGKAEKLIDELMEHVGIRLWDPAQTVNDLVEMKKKYGNELLLPAVGCKRRAAGG